VRQDLSELRVQPFVMGEESENGPWEPEAAKHPLGPDLQDQDRTTSDAPAQPPRGGPGQSRRPQRSPGLLDPPPEALGPLPRPRRGPLKDRSDRGGPPSSPARGLDRDRGRATVPSHRHLCCVRRKLGRIGVIAVAGEYWAGGVGPTRAPLSGLLESSPILFEAVPPPRRAAPQTVEQHLDRLREGLSGLKNLAALNVPEVLEENHAGRPYYRTWDAVEFASRFQQRGLGVDTVVNKVVVHMPSQGEFVRWARRSLEERGIHNFILVGGSSRLRHYPGPTVVEACGMLSHLFRRHGSREGVVGTVAIPNRDNEAQRLFAKTLAGSSFSTTQILFDTAPLKGLLRDYGRLCERFEVPPATVLISVAPISDIHDLEFVRWLGADVPDVVEDRLFQGGPEAAREQSIELAIQVWREAVEFCARERLRVPLGLNVEEVSHHNLDAAFEMARRLSVELRSGPAPHRPARGRSISPVWRPKASSSRPPDRGRYA
jgi:5,10-methylenetetrahydrofolate reductase